MAVDENGNEIVEPKNPLDARLADTFKKLGDSEADRAEKTRLLEESNARIATLEKENDFNSGFADVISTQPSAKEHKDEIKAKVLAGYSVEDATFAVLGKAGKLGNVPAPAPASPAGGSAPTNVPSGGAKSPSEMSQAERREALENLLI